MFTDPAHAVALKQVLDEEARVWRKAETARVRAQQEKDVMAAKAAEHIVRMPDRAPEEIAAARCWTFSVEKLLEGALRHPRPSHPKNDWLSQVLTSLRCFAGFDP